MLTRAGCEVRQKRLLAELERERCDLFLTSNYRTVYYLTGLLASADAPAVFALWSDGASSLIRPVDGEALADETLKVETYSIHRTITRPFHDAARLLKQVLAGARKPVRRWAAERAAVCGLMEDVVREAHPDAAVLDATTTILGLRKRKEEDEIDEIRGALRLNAVAYRAAKDALAPGLTEIDLYNTMYGAVVREAGRPVPFPGDFSCGLRSLREGGAPTGRVLQLHDLCVFDLFPEPALYAGDTCRTYSVGGPTDEQCRAFEIVREAVRLAESAVRPGVRASEVYRQVKEFLDAQPIGARTMPHHVGHGIGHHGHEAPRIIPGSDDVFEIGDVIAMEPAMYVEALQGGIRLEDNYLVHADRLENLFNFPMEL